MMYVVYIDHIHHLLNEPKKLIFAYNVTGGSIIQENH